MAIDFRTYPPAGHTDRVAAYGKFEKLFIGDHKTVFNVQVGPYQALRYIVANFPQTLSRLCADMLFGEQPDFMAGQQEGPEREKAQAALDSMTQLNSLHVVNYESALSNSFRGDAIYKVWWGAPAGDFGVESKPRAVIQEVPAAIYFPEVAEDDVREIRRVTLAWTKRDPKIPTMQYLRVEEHEPGTIKHRLLLLTGQSPGQEVPLNTLEEYKNLPTEEETGLPVIPVVHIPNFRYGSRFWGISDYQGLDALFEAMNNRLSQIEIVLDKHVAPKIILPPGFIDDQGKVRFDSMEAVEMTAGDMPPSYLTWEGQLTAAGAQYDRLLDLLMITAEIAPSLFGLEKFGLAESGRALRLRLLRTLAKINRKRLYYDRGLAEVLLIAQMLDAAKGAGGYTPVKPNIQWADGLPEDIVEMVQTEAQRLAAGNSSIESSIRRLDGPDAVEAEMDRIAEEAGLFGALMGATGGRGGKVEPPAVPGGTSGQGGQQGGTTETPGQTTGAAAGAQPTGATQ
jgi:hypothetical protein